MKKFLSLVLALVMTMSLVTVSAGAKEFKDDDSITYDEAIAVISEIGVVNGYEDGSFGPTGNLTRQAAAKIICNLTLGPTTAAALVADAAPFPDVPVSSEFAGYIAFCSQRGIINGYPDGTFKPGNSLTGYAFMKMLLGALGYDGAIEGYTGDNWSVNVAKRAIQIGLNKDLEGEFNGVKTVNREEACLYAFNTLQADLVEYDSKINATINGQVVNIGGSAAKSMTWNSSATRRNNIKEDDYVQFAEEYFTKLEKKRGTDDFERPGYTWIYDKEEIGTYVDWSLQVGEDYTKGLTGHELYDLLGVSALKENKLTYYANGQVPGNNNPTTYAKSPAKPEDASTKGGDNIIVADDVNRGNEDDLGISGRGVLTQVFLDKDHKEITVTSISTWLAKATSDYNEKREDASFDFYTNYRGYISGKGTYSKTADIQDCAAVEDVTEGTFYLLKISYKNSTGNGGAAGDIVEITEPEILAESTITKFTTSNKGENSGNRVSRVTTGGNDYRDNNNAWYSNDVLDEYDVSLLTDSTYNVYLDEYGYFIGIDLFEGTKSYVFITGYDRPTSNLSVSTANAVGIFLDGTMQEFKVNVKKTNDNIVDVNTALGGTSDKFGNQYFWKWDADLQATATDDGMYALNRWFTYTTDNNGVYTLKPADRMAIHSYYGTTAEVKIKTDNLFVDDNVRAGSAPNGGNGVGIYNLLNPTGTGSYAATKHQYYNAVEDGAWTNRIRVYGNDNSVYLTVDTDDVDTNLYGKAISEVTGVYTGVQSSEITVNTTRARLEEAQIYTVYDKDNYIIGAVIDGEGDGGSSTVAYMLDGPKSERYENGVYYWEFEAVVDGEIKTLTAKDTNRIALSTIRNETDDMHEKIGDWWAGRESTAPTTKWQKDWNKFDGLVELRYDANDYVTSIKSIDEEDIYSYFGNANLSPANTLFKGHNSEAPRVVTTEMDMSDAKAYRINGINKWMIGAGQIWNDMETPVSHNYYEDSLPDTLKLVGRTLYVTKDQSDEGLALASDATAVVVQWENGEWTTVPYSSVKTAVNNVAMNPTTGEFDGEVVAALNSNGTAAWVVITSYNEVRRSSNPIVQQRLTEVKARGSHTYYDAADGGDVEVTLGWYTASPETLRYALIGAVNGTTYHVELQVLSYTGGWQTKDEWNVTANPHKDSSGRTINNDAFYTASTTDGLNTEVYVRTGVGAPISGTAYRLVVSELWSDVAVVSTVTP